MTKDSQTCQQTPVAEIGARQIISFYDGFRRIGDVNLVEAFVIWRVMIIIAVLIAAVVIFAAAKPKTFRIQGSIDIDAPPETIFTLIDASTTGIGVDLRGRDA